MKNTNLIVRGRTINDLEAHIKYIDNVGCYVIRFYDPESSNYLVTTKSTATLEQAIETAKNALRV